MVTLKRIAPLGCSHEDANNRLAVKSGTVLLP